MSYAADRRVPAWFWIVAVLALLWEAIGCYQYLVDVERELPMPVWVTAAFGIAAWGGLVAAILLILRRRHARLFFLASLLAAIVQFGWLFTTMGVLPVGIAVLVIGAALVWFCDHAIRRGWLR